MARISRRAKNRQRSQWLMGTLALLLVIAVISGSLWWWTQRHDQPLNTTNLCPVSGPVGHKLIVIDTTDPLNLAQKSALDVQVTQIAEQETPKGFLVSVFALGQDFANDAKPLIELCNPGTAAGHNELTENIKQLDKRYQQDFLQPIFKLTQSLLDTEPAKQSPLLEMMQMVSLNSLQKHHIDGPRSLVFITDLLQNSPQLSMYQDTPDFEKFNHTYFANKTRIRFEGVDVKVLVLLHSATLQKERLYEFWRQYFKAAGAASVQIELLPG
jgi:hypothetical protein